MSMTSSELGASLTSIARHAEALRRVAADLEAMAFEAGVTGGEKVTATRVDYALDTVGDHFARKVYVALCHRAREADDILAGLRATTLNLMSKGGSAEHTRGSLISADEHDRLVGRQRDREERGDYTPARMQAQPRHPGRRS